MEPGKERRKMQPRTHSSQNLVYQKHCRRLASLSEDPARAHGLIGWQASKRDATEKQVLKAKLGLELQVRVQDGEADA